MRTVELKKVPTAEPRRAMCQGGDATQDLIPPAERAGLRLAAVPGVARATQRLALHIQLRYRRDVIVAIAPLDVAFVGAAAALIAALAAPLSVYLIARQTHDHERRLAEAERNDSYRRKAYYEVVLEAHAYIEALRGTSEALMLGEHVPPLHRLPQEQFREMLARLEVFGSGAMVERFQGFMKAVGPVAAALTAVGEELVDTETATANRAHLLNAEHLLGEAMHARRALAEQARSEFAGALEGLDRVKKRS